MTFIRCLLASCLLSCFFGELAVETVSAGDCAGGWSDEFDSIGSNWKVKKKPGTKAADFSIQKSSDGSESWLLMKADNATATLGIDIKNVDLKKTPILNWRWRVTVFPTGADGRVSEKDDQAIGIYISDGGMFSQKSLTYRWETETPVGEEGTAKYGAGTVTVYWICVRNKDGGDGVTFFEESRNLAEDFKKAYGYIPEKFNIGISCNSQYTSSKAEAQLDYIRFCPPGKAPDASQDQVKTEALAPADIETGAQAESEAAAPADVETEAPADNDTAAAADSVNEADESQNETADSAE